MTLGIEKIERKGVGQDQMIDIRKRKDMKEVQILQEKGIIRKVINIIEEIQERKRNIDIDN